MHLGILILFFLPTFPPLLLPLSKNPLHVPPPVQNGNDLQGFGLRAVYNLSRLSWKWRKRSSVKITERTYEEGTEAFHRRRKGSCPEASFGQGASLGPV